MPDGNTKPLPLWASLCGLALSAVTAPAVAAVMISQVYGGGGNSGASFSHDYVELHNSGATAVSLAGWSLQYASAGGSSWSNSTALTGSIPAGGYFLVQLASGGANGAPLPVTPDVIGSTNMSGSNGKLALLNSTALLSGTCPLPNANVADFVGYGSTASCAETANAPGLSSSTALRRADSATGCLDSDNNGSDFSAVAPLPRNSAAPAQVCSGNGGGNPVPDPALAAAIYTIQGSGPSSPLVNQVVVTSGVVTKVNSNGFFIQDLTGDANPATSDGLFVFTASATYAAVAVGNLVRVTGTVLEFNTGAIPTAATPTPTLTELSAVSGVTLIGTGYSISPTPVALPETVEGELERYEGMLIRIDGPLTVAQNFFQGRYGQLTLAAGGRLETPTNRYRPGSAQAMAMADENARRRILLDDGSSLQNPNPVPYFSSEALPRAGDTAASLTGVLDFGLATNANPGPGDYKLHPTLAPQFSTANPRSPVPPGVGGSHRVASFNVLNYFTTFTNGETADGATGQGCTLGASTSPGNCRGANNLAEFNRQRSKIVAAMTALTADVVGLMEIQNNGNLAVQNLVDGLNAAMGAGTYASVALPPEGTGTDAIRVAMVYKPARLTPVGAPVSDTDPVNNRPTLAQTFAASNGERFTLVVNHLKSKGSCPSSGAPDAAGNTDAGDGQGCWNAQRVLQAQRLRSFVAALQGASGSNDVLLIGDFNAYALEDPVFALTSSGFSDQIARFNPLGYSYVFDGAAGRLDHAIATGALSGRVTGARLWHINADETPLLDYNLEFKAPLSTCGLGGSSACPADPTSASAFRSSDHDPVLVGLQLINPGRRAPTIQPPRRERAPGAPAASTR